MGIGLDARLALEQRDAARDRYGAQVRAAARNQSTRELAAQLGVSQPYVVKVIRDAESAYESNPYLTLDTLAALIRVELESGGPLNHKLRLVAQAISDFRSLERPHDRRTFLAEPNTTGDVVWDAVLAAVAEHESNRLGVMPPTWVHHTKFIMTPWQFLTDVPGLRAWAFTHSLPEFAARNIYLDAKNLESV
ncbi:MAG: hypothetical protein ACOYBP_00535 [Microbacteriaceae bacterium]